MSLVASDEREAFDEGGSGDESIRLVERGVLTAKIDTFSLGSRIRGQDGIAAGRFDALSLGIAKPRFVSSSFSVITE